MNKFTHGGQAFALPKLLLCALIVVSSNAFGASSGAGLLGGRLASLPPGSSLPARLPARGDVPRLYVRPPQPIPAVDVEATRGEWVVEGTDINPITPAIAEALGSIPHVASKSAMPLPLAMLPTSLNIPIAAVSTEQAVESVLRLLATHYQAKITGGAMGDVAHNLLSGLPANALVLNVEVGKDWNKVQLTLNISVEDVVVEGRGKVPFSTVIEFRKDYRCDNTPLFLKVFHDTSETIRTAVAHSLSTQRPAAAGAGAAAQ